MDRWRKRRRRTERIVAVLCSDVCEFETFINGGTIVELPTPTVHELAPGVGLWKGALSLVTKREPRTENAERRTPNAKCRTTLITCRPAEHHVPETLRRASF